MSSVWYQNTKWDEAIERAFFQKLQRAKRKEQYLRVQASVLSRTHPEVALRLLEQYFTFDVQTDRAQAWVDRASAFVALGRWEEAVESYLAALDREAEFPNVLTQAYVELPYLVATRRMRDKYRDAVRVLEMSKARLTPICFPLELFRWHAAYALLLADQGVQDDAAEHARGALETAARTHSGFHNHPELGLVRGTGEVAKVREELKRIASLR